MPCLTAVKGVLKLNKNLKKLIRKKSNWLSVYHKMSTFSYSNKIILAPMVRIGTLPMRLLALDYGADLVYTEELIDFKFLRSVRRINDVLGTVDYVDKSDGSVVFRTCSKEKGKVVLQLGTCDASRALKVAQMVQNDVVAIDINMGCPKNFSLAGGMGAALMSQSETAKKILSVLVQNLKIPVSCKIRVFSDTVDTINLVKDLASTGISAIAIHGRTKEERPQHANRTYMLKAVAESVDIPVIANGGSKDIQEYADIDKFHKASGCTSVMIARAAEGNCSIFRPEGMLPMDDVIREYLRYSVDYDNAPSNTKYCIQNILKELQETPRGKKFLECQTLEQICAIWDMATYCRKKQLEYHSQGIISRSNIVPNMFDPRAKRRKTEHSDITEMQCAFIRACYSDDSDLPKTKLLTWCKKNKLKYPVYMTENEDKLFKSVVTVEDKKYSSTFWEKNKRFAEQGAALVCLASIGLIDTETLIKNGSILK